MPAAREYRLVHSARTHENCLLRICRHILIELYLPILHTSSLTYLQFAHRAYLFHVIFKIKK
jgi:hypothetical protein